MTHLTTHFELGHSVGSKVGQVPYGDHMFVVTTQVLTQLVGSTDTTIPDDFHILYPEDVPDNIKNLASSGLGLGPFVVSAVILLVVGMVMIGNRRRRRA